MVPVGSVSPHTLPLLWISSQESMGMTSTPHLYHSLKSVCGEPGLDGIRTRSPKPCLQLCYLPPMDLCKPPCPSVPKFLHQWSLRVGLGLGYHSHLLPALLSLNCILIVRPCVCYETHTSSVPRRAQLFPCYNKHRLSLGRKSWV